MATDHSAGRAVRVRVHLPPGVARAGRTRRWRPSLPTSVVLLALIMSAAGPARATGPTTSQCLEANETAITLREQHKLKAARDQSLVCATPTCPGAVRDACQGRVKDLTSTIPTIVFEVKDAAGHELLEVRVTMDGERAADRLDGSALTLDPGSHQFTFEAAGQPTTTQPFLLHDGDRNRHLAVTLGPPAPTPVATDPVPTDPSRQAGHGRRVAGVVVGSAGLAAVAAGGVFGCLGFSSWSSANAACPTRNNCSAAAVSDRSSAVTFATVSNIGFIAGGLLVATGVTIYLTAPKDGAPAAALQVMPGGVSLAGRF